MQALNLTNKLELIIWPLCLVGILIAAFCGGRMSVSTDHEVECAPEMDAISQLEAELDKLSAPKDNPTVYESMKCVDRERKLCDERLVKTKKLFKALRCKVCAMDETNKDKVLE